MAGCVRKFLMMYISLCSLWTFSGSSITNITDRHSSEEDFLHNNYLKHPHLSEDRRQHGRIFQIINKRSHIRMELAFAIPFVEIPIFGGEGPHGTREPLVHINMAALASAGVLASAAFIFAPKFFHGISPQFDIARKLDPDQSGVTQVLSRIDEKLQTHDIDTSVCTQRAVCWLVKNAASKVLHGRGGSMDKIIDGLTSNFWLQSLVNGTAVQEAMHVGRRNENCNMVYSKCHINESRLQSAFKYFMKDV